MQRRGNIFDEIYKDVFEGVIKSNLYKMTTLGTT